MTVISRNLISDLKEMPKVNKGYDPSKYYVYDKRDKTCDWSLHIPKDQALELVNHDKHYYLLD